MIELAAPVAPATTEQLTLIELLGQPPSVDYFPSGWEISAYPLSQIPIGSTVWFLNLRVRQWQLGEIIEYWEKGDFLTVQFGGRSQKIFTPQHLALKI